MFIKKVFRFFETFFARLASKFGKSTNLTFKKIFVKKKKIPELHADFKSVENVMEICTFSTSTHVRQTCVAFNFFWVHF